MNLNSSCRTLFAVLFFATITMTVGCAGRPSLIPNSDPALRRTAAQFSADSARRTYPTTAPHGGETVGRAEVGYTLNVLEIANLSDETWIDIEVWVNREYVVFVPKIEPGKLRTINFQMLYNAKGDYFPTDNKNVLVDKVDVLKDGKVYDIPVHIALRD